VQRAVPGPGYGRGLFLGRGRDGVLQGRGGRTGLQRPGWNACVQVHSGPGESVRGLVDLRDQRPDDADCRADWPAGGHDHRQRSRQQQVRVTRLRHVAVQGNEATVPRSPAQ
jgi:hypothetical protein